MGFKLNLATGCLALLGFVAVMPNWRGAIVAGLVLPGLFWLTVTGAGRFLRGPSDDDTAPGLTDPPGE
jgi:hypothetical protein